MILKTLLASCPKNDLMSTTYGNHLTHAVKGSPSHSDAPERT